MISKRKVILFLGDTFIILLSLNLAYLIRLKNSIRLFGSVHNVILFLFLLYIYLLSFYVFDFYELKNKIKPRLLFMMLIGALAFVSLLVTIAFYLFPFSLGRGIFLISLIFIGTLVYAWRLLFLTFFRLAVPPRKVIIVGTGKPAQAIYSFLKENPEYKVVGFIDDHPKKKNSSEIDILGGSPVLEQIVSKHKVNDIILAIEPTRNKRLSKALVNCKMRGTNLYDVSTFYEYLMGKLPVLQIKERWFLYSGGFNKLGSDIYKRIKRAIDFLVSLIILILTLPLTILIILFIKLTSRGPILLVQERLGENKKPFNMIKFRTMVADAEQGEPKWAEENDARVTPFGKILRKTRLDELPQLINVIKGEMSIIGPRPEREFFIRTLIEKIPFYSLRFSVKPGITGWAQVNYRYASNLEDAIEKLRYELYYIKNQSILLDLKILLKTFRIVMFGMGR